MNPRQQLLKVVLKDLEKTLDRGVVTPEELIQSIEVLVAKIESVKKELEQGIVATSTNSSRSTEQALAKLSLAERRLSTLIDGVRQDLYTDISEARDRFERGIQGVQSRIPTVPDLTYLEQGIEEVRNSIPAVPDIAPLAVGLEEVREDVEETNEKIQSLSERIEEVRTTAPAPGGMPTLRLHVNGSYIGNTRDLFLSGSGVSSTITNGNQTIVITGGGPGGFTIETPTGTINAVNTSFVCSSTPQYMIADGISYFEGKGYSIAGLTVTFDVPPSQYVRAII